MARVRAIARDTDANLDALTTPGGKSWVLAVGTTNKVVRLFDGSTLGGIKLAKSNATLTLGSTTLTLGTTTTTVAGLTLTTPVLGVATATSIAIGGATLGSNALAVTGHLLLEGVTSTGATGTGALVFGTGPTVSGATLSGTTTLPGSGQITSGGSLGLGGAPDRLLTVGGGTGTAVMAVKGAASGTSAGSVYLLEQGVGNTVTGAWGNFSSIFGGAFNNDMVFQNGVASATRFYVNSSTFVGMFDASGNFSVKNQAPQALVDIGTTAATVRSRNLFTDASNGEWAYMGDWGFTSNVATFGTDKNGTGSTRNIQFVIGGTNKLDYGVTTAATWTHADKIAVPGGTTPIITTTTAVTSGAGASVGTLTNAPTAGNPTKWVPINDNGTTRYIPAW